MRHLDQPVERVIGIGGPQRRGRAVVEVGRRHLLDLAARRVFGLRPDVAGASCAPPIGLPRPPEAIDILPRPDRGVVGGRRPAPGFDILRGGSLGQAEVEVVEGGVIAARTVLAGLAAQGEGQTVELVVVVVPRSGYRNRTAKEGEVIDREDRKPPRSPNSQRVTMVS